MSAKYYLDQEGLIRLVQYINDHLNQKLNINDVPILPQDLVHIADLQPYALKTDIPEEPDLSGFATSNDVNNIQADLAADIEAVRNLATGVYHYKGSVADLTALEAIQNPEQGDVYNIESTGMNAAWTGSAWDEFGSTIDLSGYLLKEDVNSITDEELDSILYGGTFAIVSDNKGFSAMINNNEPEVEIQLAQNMTAAQTIVIPEGKTVTLDLGGNTLQGGAPLTVNGGELIISNGSIRATSGNGITATNGGTVTVDGASITSNKYHGISAIGAEVIVNSGEVTSQEAGIAGFKDSVITINGGTITGIDNCPIMGNGSAAGSANDGTNMNVVMNGGTLIAHITTAGYTACGVYIPNTGSFTMNGGEIISDGAGLVMRGGTVTLNGGEIHANGTSGTSGKVGDARQVVGPYAVVYDQSSKYPANATLALTIGQNMILDGTDGDLQVLTENGVAANIQDNRI